MFFYSFAHFCRSYIKSAIEQDKNGQKSKKTFTFIKHKKTDITGVSPLLDEQGTIQSDDKKLAEILNAQFGSVFSTDDNVTPNIAGQQSPKITEIVFTSEGIKRLLRKITQKRQVAQTTSQQDCSILVLKLLLMDSFFSSLPPLNKVVYLMTGSMRISLLSLKGGIKTAPSQRTIDQSV